MTRKRWLQVTIAGLAAIALAVAGYVFFKPDTQPTSDDPWSVSTDAAGGTYTFPDGREITVRPDTVDKETTLKVGRATQVAADQPAPFSDVRTGAVMFDVSLVQNGEEIQPFEPLDITIPLEGDLLPEGSDPNTALLYTELAENQYWYMPARVENKVLVGELYHLSPKYVAYLNEAEFLKKYPLGDGYAKPEDCQDKVETSAGEVEFGPATSGWSNDDSSPIGACLVVDEDGNLSLGVANWLHYIVSVDTSDGMELAATSGGVDEELVKYFADLIYPGELDAFIGIDGYLEATIPIDSLPARMDIKANANTYLAQVGLFALGAVLDIFTGGAGTQAVRAVLEIVDVVSCIQDAFDISVAPEDLTFIKVVDLLVSQCTVIIAEAIGYDMGWGLFGRWFSAVRLVVDGIRLLVTGFEGLKAQFMGDVTVEVVQVVPDCLPHDEFESVVREWIDAGNSYIPPGDEIQITETIICQDGWAYSGTAHLEDFGFTDPAHTTMYWADGEWTMYYLGGTGQEPADLNPEYCDPYPPLIWERMCF